ncbi:MAG: TRAP transporter small permease [Hydrogenophaga sp.]|uniref:TRAP transporter small permease n=1 Tax=Hydrogenophaga sp. TaxID=1904254 RepID=UPI003D0EA923
MSRVVATAERALDTLTGVLLLALMMLTTVDVLGRNLLRQPVPGATELTELMLAGIVFLAFPRLAYRQGHIVVDLLDFLTGPRTRRIQTRFAAVLSAATFAGLTWPLHRAALRVMEDGDTTIQLGIPLYYPLWLMSAVCLVTGAAFVLGIFCNPPTETPTAGDPRTSC